jgi:predicted 2-oxoglutarate/Fe(II)-dependent dioxygenase YbiX
MQASRPAPQPAGCWRCAALRAAPCRRAAQRRSSVPSSAVPQTPPPPDERSKRPRPTSAATGSGVAAPRSSAAAFAASAARLQPLARRVLLDGGDPSAVDAAELLRALPLRREDKAAAEAALAAPSGSMVLSIPAALSPAQCAALRQLVSARVSGVALDTADGCPEWQLNLTRQELERVVGGAATAALWALPRALDPAGAPARFTQVRAFARAYGPDKRPHLRLHTDASDYTVNVALADDDQHEGGRLAMLHSGALHAAARAEGEATVHRWSVAHGVTAVTRGTRFSLILFFFHRRQPVM